MSTSAEVEKASTGITYATAAFGAFSALLPDAFLRAYLAEPSPELRGLTRMWGVANLGLAAALRSARTEEERRRHLMVAAGVSGGNVVAIAVTGGGSKAGRLMGLASSAGFLAAAVYGLTRG